MNRKKTVAPINAGGPAPRPPSKRRSPPASKPSSASGGPACEDVHAAEVLAQGLQNLLATFDRVRQELSHRYAEEAVHQLRVTARRLLTLSRLLMRTGFPTPAPGLLRTVKRVRCVLGPGRDVDVLFQRVLVKAGAREEQGPPEPSPKLVRSLEIHRKHLHAEARESVVHLIDDSFAIEASGWCAAVSAHVAAMKLIPAAPDGQSIGRHAAKEIERTCKRAARRMASLHRNGHRGLHDSRIAVKELRYCVEALRDLMPAHAVDPWCFAMAHLQSELGHAHDAEAAWGIVAKTAARRGDADFLRKFRRWKRRVLVERSHAAWTAWRAIKRLDLPWPVLANPK